MATTATTAPQTGLLNLEKELVCFICTEVLYQPLTLIDCLHSFCGSCLKEWFSHQYRKASHSHSSSSASPYTCPTCRAPVKDAQHNAMINTLLDMFLAANPSKARSEQEKAEMAQGYNPTDNIMPKVESHRRRERRRREEEEIAARERRTANDAIRERAAHSQLLDPEATASRGSRASQPRSRDRRDRRDRSENSRDSDRRQTRNDISDSEAVPAHPPSARSSDSFDQTSLSPPPTSPRHPDAVEARQRGVRTVAHQASLRSIVSASESGTGTGDSLSEAQLMQDIIAEGLLDGINVDELTEDQQDELSERIAERYRQLHPERVRRRLSNERRAEARHNSLPTPPAIRHQDTAVDESNSGPRQASRNSARRQTQPSPRPTHPVPASSSDLRPPTSYPQISPEQALTPPQQSSRRRRASNESGRSEASTARSSRTAQVPATRTASNHRSATDLSNRPQSSSFSSDRPRQPSNTERSNTDPQRSPRASDVWRAGGGQVASPPEFANPIASAAPVESTRTISTGPSNAPIPVVPLITSDPGASAPEPAIHPVLMTTFDEPTISCARCNTESRRQTRDRARERASFSLPLTQLRASRKATSAIVVVALLMPAFGPVTIVTMASGDFATIVSIPSIVAPIHCYPSPTNHMTLDLLVIVKEQSATRVHLPSSAASANGTSPGPRADFIPLIITTNCDICSRPIAPEEMRYHCPSHPTPSPDSNDQVGDFDICSDCYHGHVKTGRIPPEDGPDGWRLCLAGHRMVSITFDPDRDGGQRRTVICDLVGGTKLSKEDMLSWRQRSTRTGGAAPSIPISPPDQGQWSWREDPSGTKRATRSRSSAVPDATATKFPLDGGTGKVCRALWSYYPDDGEDGHGELMFPKHAEVRETEEVNEDWWYGVYAGDMGVFPSVYVREVS
ncbi:hypothetical protein B0A52_05695 [Exophiala mesophila]|uniref:RING-type domain-containing protein n=1 Tax=Exophiala mesophila TaxID=212818 RepID=A0A438N2A2_EXOME|nr:hypothetical protein B0A52_05695 [Exophiala mesophila]